MNWKKVCIVGFKVLTAIVAGAAVFKGFQAAGQRNTQPSEGEEKLGSEDGNQRSSGEVIVDGLRATGDTCGKIIGFVSSLAGVFESGSRIFGKGSYSPYYDNSPWNYSGYGGYVSGNNGETLVRRSQFIVEAVPRRNGPYMNDNRENYPF